MKKSYVFLLPFKHNSLTMCWYKNLSGDNHDSIYLLSETGTERVNGLDGLILIPVLYR